MKTSRTHFDSDAEQAFQNRHPDITADHDYYPCTFFDADNIQFSAKKDFYDEATATYIEFKSHQLNTKKTQAESIHAYDKSVSFVSARGMDLFRLETQWCHSLYKQKLVQSSLEAVGIKMVVVFAKGTKLTTTSKNKMTREGLTWFYEEDYFNESTLH